jgi:hypothetical protein
MPMIGFMATPDDQEIVDFIISQRALGISVSEIVRSALRCYKKSLEESGQLTDERLLQIVIQGIRTVLDERETVSLPKAQARLAQPEPEPDPEEEEEENVEDAAKAELELVTANFLRSFANAGGKARE